MKEFIFVLIVLVFSTITYANNDGVAKPTKTNNSHQEVILKTPEDEVAAKTTAAKKEVADKELAEFNLFMTKKGLSQDNFETDGARLYKKKGSLPTPFHWKAKCSKYDFRTFHFCPDIRFLEPSARVYFDTGIDGEDEIDIFDNGSLNLTIELVYGYVPWRFGHSEFYDNWSWGPILGFGIGTPAEDSEDGQKDASDAPIVLLSFGLMTEYKLNNKGARFAIEIGRAKGWSSDESVGDIDDGAFFMGIKIAIPTSGDNK